MSGNPGLAGVSASVRTRFASSGRSRVANQNETQSMDRNVGGTIRDGRDAVGMRAGDDDAREHRTPIGDRRQRGAEKIHAAVAVVAVHRRAPAAQIGERLVVRVRSDDDEAAGHWAIATRHVVARGRDIADAVAKMFAERISAGLREQKVRLAPDRLKRPVPRQMRRRVFQAAGDKVARNRDPEGIKGIASGPKLIHAKACERESYAVRTAVLARTARDNHVTEQWPAANRPCCSLGVRIALSAKRSGGQIARPSKSPRVKPRQQSTPNNCGQKSKSC